MEIGLILREERIRNKLSQEEVAKAIGSTKQAVYKYENGIVTNIPMDKIEKMASLFGVTPAYIMGWEEETSPASEEVLTEEERLLIDLFRQIPEEQQRVFLEMGRVYANSLKKD
jgi:transcriptional regulator with XRE-family HTH domain